MEREPVNRSWFIAGTDTGIGKTVISCGLLQALVKRGMRAVGMKPIAAGAYEVDGQWRNEDVEALRDASSVVVERELINPYLLREPIAPHIAARDEGVQIDLDVIARCFAQLSAKSDAVIVEGVGGLLVPLDDREDAAQLAVRLDLPVILVVGVRLGCLSHALLTQEAIAARGLRLAGWVANRIDAAMPKDDENIDTLRHRLVAPLLGDVPFLAAPRVTDVAARLDVEPLLAAS